MKRWKKYGSVLLALSLAGAGTMPVHAEIASGQAFEDSSWYLLAENEIKGSNGLVQSVCCTKDYIITLENYNDNTTEPDVISAYYRNDTDEYGNPVEQYSLAKQLQETDYGHANGMAYNPTTNEIIVCEYSSQNSEDDGCVYIVDATTLQFKEKRKISDTWNPLGIEYLSDQDAYLVQTDEKGGYRFLIMDNDFQILEDWGSYQFDMTGRNFQDLCASGDYFINFPLTKDSGMGDYIDVYSISQKSKVDSVPLDFNFDDSIVNDEPEGICETDPGVFVAVVNVYYANGYHACRLYQTSVPYLFTVTAGAEHGVVSSDSQKVLGGDSCSVSYTAEEGYEVSTIRVDGVYVDASEYADGYTFDNVGSNHTVEIYCSPIQSTAVSAPDDTSQSDEIAEPIVKVSTASASIPESQTGNVIKSEIIKVTWVQNLGFRMLVIVGAILLFVWSYLQYSRFEERRRSRKILERNREVFREQMREASGDEQQNPEIWNRYVNHRY